MEWISKYLFSIIGIIILGIIIDTVIPKGNLAKYIKGIYSFFIVFVIISPLVNFNVNNLSFKSYDLTDYTLLEKFYNTKIELMQKQIQTQLNLNGISGVDVQFVSQMQEKELIINCISVFLSNMVIDKNFEHIDEYQVIQDTIISITNVGKEKIIYYE